MKNLLIVVLIVLNLISVLVLTKTLKTTKKPSNMNTDLGIPNDWIEESPMDVDSTLLNVQKGKAAKGKGKGKGPASASKSAKSKSGKSTQSSDKKSMSAPEAFPMPDGIPADPANAHPIETKSNKKSEKLKIEKPKAMKKLVDICDEPVIVRSINHFRNSTIRLYRDDSSWDLMGLPDKQGFTTPKEQITVPNMGPVEKDVSIVTVLEGPKNLTFKFQRQFFWAWDENGKQVSGGKGGEHWADLPKGGFNTMFHNGNKTKPMFIAFKKDKVYYISTKENDFDFVGNSEGHIGGKYGENFPTDITAAFTWPLSDNQVMVYLFKEDKYCLRDLSPPASGKDCDEWRESKELFGCSKLAKYATTVLTAGADKDEPNVRVDGLGGTSVIDSKPSPTNGLGSTAGDMNTSPGGPPGGGAVDKGAADSGTNSESTPKSNTAAPPLESAFVSILGFTSILFTIIIQFI